MTTTNFQTGQKFKAVSDINVLYTYKLGGGIKGRKVKKDDVITFLGSTTEIDTPCISSYELLHKMTLESFKKYFVAI